MEYFYFVIMSTECFFLISFMDNHIKYHKNLIINLIPNLIHRWQLPIIDVSPL